MNQGYTHNVRNDFTCVSCGYSIRGVAIEGLCPECGTPIQRSLMSSGAPTSGYAVASLVLGIVSILGCMGYGLPSIICGPLAIYFGSASKKQIERGERNANSRGMAQAGYICGIVGTCLAVLGLGFFALIILGAFAGAAGGGGFGP